MKHKSWQLKLFLAVVVLTLIACEAVTGIAEEDPYWDEEPLVAEQNNDTNNNDVEDTPPLSAVAEDETCLEEESYHAESGLCYLDGEQAETLFTSWMEGVTDYGDDFEEKLLDGEYVLVVYAINDNEIDSPTYEDVSDDLLDEQDNTPLHETVWAFYAAMIPNHARDFVSHYVVMTDGIGGTLAAVEQNPADPYTWMLSVDISDTENLRELTFTLIHEYGHLLTLNPQQVEVDEYIFNNPDDEDAYYEAEVSCATYFTGEGCANNDSYFYLFFNEFWTDIYTEWSDIQYIEDEDAYYAASDDFYFAYEDQFVTDYAVTNPGEDIAESWAFFVTQAKPTGNTLAEKKVLFFYEFPELVSLREEIIGRTYSRMIRMQ
ncbi:MAG: hypothetical protein HN975_06855 [Anaerolineae bacterium]|nr:hypothetical protein [Anaerolineae bacterium]MBT7070592.1 hypothetical protein [Anaerolineae bacterium]